MEGVLDPTDPPSNPIEPGVKLEPPTIVDGLEQVVQPQQVAFVEDSAVTKAEKYEHHGENVADAPSKRIKLEHPEIEIPARSERVKGMAPIKAEFLVHVSANKRDDRSTVHNDDDDAAEGAAHHQGGGRAERGKGKKNKGQNTGRQFTRASDEVGLCSSRACAPEFSPEECQFGDSCRFEHDIRKYLREGKREDLKTFEGVCPVWKANGKCDVGWKCRFVGSHMQERDTVDDKRELVLVERESSQDGVPTTARGSITNDVSPQARTDLTKRRFKTPKSDIYNHDLENRERQHNTNQVMQVHHDHHYHRNTSSEEDASQQDNRAQYTDPPLLPSEKRPIYFGPETPVLAPLTTQGNLPFRRLCVSLGAQATYSEMAMSLPLIQGSRSEWALMRAHASETLPPAYSPPPTTSATNIVTPYTNSNDLKFSAQIAANKPWQAIKATEILTALCPHLRLIDLNAGCPIDLVFRQGAGSALLDHPSKLTKILRGMSAVSSSIPISVKIRMGTKDARPTALKLVDRLIHGTSDVDAFDNKPAGVAAITLHGRSRQQRYTRSADWGYIASCAALIDSYNEKADALADTVREPDPRHQPNGKAEKVFFLGNGDCYSHSHYTDHLRDAKVDSVMIARGALIKPWIFEEIATGQYIDKSASERLGLVETFAKYGLEVWGSDERGVGVTRRFLLEWLSFAYRYVPVGLLEYLPPNLQDRPPAWRGRNELESLLGSGDYRDWVKITGAKGSFEWKDGVGKKAADVLVSSEMFLGPTHKDFKFQPKHKSNSYEIEAEG
ncbi:uncharacterized protein KY384_001654 [Bacidia gigantensis]|uniref:uncharacterized protein n=1 Tax=Bacidia gigantensis TaxID=2732470 RepID=UPI001D04A612|nr:uncharacterized protein KY384_001654 [Bacidia gigantensis]KAG8533913.1 hypothetical protein KY384_001654 [Bacidia gigantensis]